MEACTITHTDLDGVACAALLEDYLGNAPSATRRHWWSSPVTGDVDKCVREALQEQPEALFIADLSPSPECAKEIEAALTAGCPQLVVLADHHQTALALRERYTWAEVDTRACGAQVLARTLTSRSMDSWICSRSFLDLVAARDLWQRDHELWAQSRQLHDLLLMIGPGAWVRVASEHSWVLAPWTPGSDHLSAVSLSARDLLVARREAEQARIDRAVEHADTTVDSQGRRVRWTRADSGITSELAHRLLHTGSGALSVDYVAIVMPDIGLVSLRSRQQGGCDVSAIAKALGGGGHRNAAGYPVPRGDWNCLQALLP